jgi:hypothetical protein
MPRMSRFVEPGDRAEVGDDVVFHGDQGNFVRGIVADAAVSPLSNVTSYRVVDSWSGYRPDCCRNTFLSTLGPTRKPRSDTPSIPRRAGRSNPGLEERVTRLR